MTLIENIKSKFNIIAKTNVKCLLLSLEKIKETLGPLKELLIDDEKKRQDKLSTMQSYVDFKSENSLINVKNDDFNILHKTATTKFSDFYIVKHKVCGKEFTLRVMSIDFINKNNLQNQIIREKDILKEYCSIRIAKIPFFLDTIKTETNIMYLYNIIIINTLRYLITNGIITNEIACFFSAKIIIGIEYLHIHDLMFRSIDPSLLCFTSNGDIVYPEHMYKIYN